MSMIRLVKPEPWTTRRACTPEDLHLFYASGHGPRGERLRKERAAKAICAFCPVKAECLDYALRLNDEHGIYGGMTSEERYERRRELPRPCRTCGTLFVAKRTSSRGGQLGEFCSDDCRQEAVRVSKLAYARRSRGIAS